MPIIKKPFEYFNVVTYTGNGTARTISGVGFQPDFVWIKVRNTAGTHVLTDSVRGANKQLFSNLTNAEGTATNKVTGFTSDGFTLGADDGSGTGDANFNGNTYVAWCWKANGTGVTNTAGSITSTVSANTSAGFSIVTWTGNGSSADIGHGLGVAPKMIIAKSRTVAQNWAVYHASIGNNKWLQLNSTSASITEAIWQNSDPTSTVFKINGNSILNTNGSTSVAYCFSEVAGYSKFGSFVGNGSTDGTFVSLPFKPKFIMVKRTDSTGFWTMLDSSRSPFNVIDDALYANASNAESTPAQNVDFLSNGFKFRSTDSDTNSNGGTHVYMAFAETPFKYSLGK